VKESYRARHSAGGDGSGRVRDFGVASAAGGPSSLMPTFPSLVRRLSARTASAAVLLTLVATGLATPAPSTPKPVVADKVVSLSTDLVQPGWTKSATPDQPAQLVGFEWQGNTPGAMELKVRTAQGWSEWARVEGDPAEGPDATSKEHHPVTTAGPVWVGQGVKEVAVRVAEGSVRGLKLHAVRSEDAKSGGGVKPAGASPQPGIVSRAAWGADESWRSINPGCGHPDYAPAVRFAIVHHTDNPNNYGPGDSAALMRGIYYFHTHGNHWCDIGYNFVVDRYGTVFEGRFGGIDRPVIGAHALNFNTGSTGVAMLGTFQTDSVPGATYGAVRSLLAWKLGISNVDPTSAVTNNGLTFPAVAGHRDVNATDCPGNLGESVLPQLRADLAGMVGTPPRTNVVSALSNKLMAVAGGSQAPGTQIMQWQSDGTPSQQWRFSPLGDNTYEIVNVGSGQALDVAWSATFPGAPVIQWPWYGGTSQRWRVVPMSSVVSGGNPSALQITNVNSGLTLAVAGNGSWNGVPMIQWPWNGGTSQMWGQLGA
jgi:hypothetical protein